MFVSEASSDDDEWCACRGCGVSVECLCGVCVVVGLLGGWGGERGDNLGKTKSFKTGKAVEEGAGQEAEVADYKQN